MDRRDVENGLERKGFRAQGGDHRYFVYFTEDGKKTAVRTKTSHGSQHKSISPELISQMARQCRLKKQQFLDLVECPMSGASYELVLREQTEI
jgi:predicted RNA binding protein YcfA (HicA-like mRNA interferase family)